MNLTESTKTIDGLISLLKSEDLGLINMAFLVMKRQLKYIPAWLKACAIHVHGEEIYLLRCSDGFYFFNTNLESILFTDYHVFVKNIDGNHTTFIMDISTRKVYDLCFKHVITIPSRYNVKSNIIFKRKDDWFFAETNEGVGILRLYDRFGTEIMTKNIPKSHFIVGYEKGAIKMGGLRNGGFKRLKVPKF